jgi:hypothetical protein
MRNADIIRALPTRSAKKAELKTVKRSITSARTKVDKLEGLIEVLDEVTEIIDGVAVRRLGTWLEAVGDDIKRAASIYPNAHNNGKTYGIHTYTDAFGHAGERWHGAEFSRVEADQIALDWVIRGKRPER